MNDGVVPERTNGSVLKTEGVKAPVGSNPTYSSKYTLGESDGTLLRRRRMSAHLHSTCATDFDVWISDSDLCETELNEALRILEIKRSNLWTPGHDDSYYRNRYDLDALYVERMNKIKERLAKCWMSAAVHLT